MQAIFGSTCQEDFHALQSLTLAEPVAPDKVKDTHIVLSSAAEVECEWVVAIHLLRGFVQ
jgi:hypothetical protein